MKSSRCPSGCAAILLLVISFLQAAAEGRMSMDMEESSKISDGMTFLHSEAERWSFQTQMQKSVPNILERVERTAKELMKTRYHFGRAAKIPDYWKDLSSKASSRERLNGTIYFLDGWANGFPNISLVGESKVTYEGSAIKIRSDVNVWSHMVFSYSYKIIKNCNEFKGRIKKDINDARYSLTIALDATTKSMELLDFRRKSVGRPTMRTNGSPSDRGKDRPQPGVQGCDHEEVLSSSVTECYSAGDIHVDELNDRNRLKNVLVSVFTDFYRTIVFPDVEAVLSTILEDSFRNSSVVDLLPKIFYSGRQADKLQAAELDVCDSDAEETRMNGDSLRWKPVTEVPFIQNSGEMWAFQKQIDSALGKLMERISVGMTENLAERDLLRGKLADDKFLMTIKDRSSTTRHAPLFLVGGRYSGQFKFSVSAIRQVKFQDGYALFTASFRLEDPIEFSYNFTTMFLRENYEGFFKGSVKFVEYAMRFSANLETAVITLVDPKLDCAREISSTVTGIRPEMEWFSSELTRNAERRFIEASLPQIHSIISGALRYATSSSAPAEDWLPSWNYDRDFRTEFDMRIGENDEDAVDTCDAERVRKLKERSRQFTELISEDGTFNDRVPNADGKYFTHVSGVKNVGIRFTSTKTQSWYFEQDLRLKLNSYMYTLLNTTRRILQNRDLGKVKMPDYTGAANDKGGRNVRLRNCWIGDLTSITFTGVDLMEFDQKAISLWTNILVYEDLKFEGEYVTSGSSGSRLKGNLAAQLPPVEVSLRIDIDYLGEKRAKLDYMKLECIGARSASAASPSTVEPVSVDVFFREEMSEPLFHIFRRAFEDAMEETDLQKFLPIWDYKRDYITDIILNQNMNRYQSNIKFCNGTENHRPSIEEFYPDEETVPESRFLPKVKMVGLRRSFERQIKLLMDDAIRSMWRHMLRNPLKRFSPLKFADKGITWSEDSEESHEALVISAIDFQGLTPDVVIDEVELAYGKEDTLIILYQLSFDYFKVTYNLSLEGHPVGEGEHGKAIATAEDPRYLLKVRYFLSNSTFSIDEFFLRCLRNLSVTTHGLRTEGDPKLDAVKDSILTSFPVWEMSEVREVLFDLFRYAAVELDMKSHTHSWTYDRELFNIATREEEQEKETESCNEGTKFAGYQNCSCNGTVIPRGDLSFIGSEAEWWSFSKLTKTQANLFKKMVRINARAFLKDHALDKMSIPDLTKNLARETDKDSNTVVCRLTEGIAGILMAVKYVGNVTVDAGKDMKITAFVTFDGDLKFRYRLEAKDGKGFALGRVIGTAKSVIYKMVIGVDKENKSASMESFDFECMSDMRIFSRITDKKFLWLNGLIPDAFQGDFTSLVKGDIKKILEMAFTFGVKNAGVLPFVEDWNYRKDYGQKRHKEVPMATNVFPSCPAA